MIKGTLYNQLLSHPQNILILHNPTSTSTNFVPIQEVSSNNTTSTLDSSKTISPDYNPMISPFVFTPLSSPIATDGPQSFVLNVNNNTPISVLTNVSNIDMNVLKLNLESLKRPLPFTIENLNTSMLTATSTSSLQPLSESSPDKTTKTSQTTATSTSVTTTRNTCVSSEQSKEKVYLGPCKVCGDVASGKYFGALVCVPCKTFFLRYAGEGFSFVCKGHQNCDISLSTRIQCKYCRFKKCLEAGMNRKVRPLQVEPKEGRQLCVVCSDIGNGVHFGAMTCEGCKKFFRRGLNEHTSYVCKYEKNCLINPQTRNACRFCRYNKCKKLGMSREAIQMGRPSKVLHHQHRQLKKIETMECDLSTALDLTTTSKSLNYQTDNTSNPILNNTVANIINNRNDDKMSKTNSRFNIKGFNNNYNNNKSEELSSEKNIKQECDKANNFVINSFTSAPNNTMNAANIDLQNTNIKQKSPVRSNITEDGESQIKKNMLIYTRSSDLNNNFTSNPTSFIAFSKTPHNDKSFTPQTSETDMNHNLKNSILQTSQSSPTEESKMQDSHSDSTVSSSTPTDSQMQTDEPIRSFQNDSQTSSHDILLTPTTSGILTNPQGTSVEYSNPGSIDKFKKFVAEGYRQKKKIDDDDLKPVTESRTKVTRQSCSSPSVTSSEDNYSLENKQVVVASSTQFLMQVLEHKIMQSLEISEKYWLAPFPHDDNLMFSDARHWDIINHIFPNYDRFVQMSEKINRSLNNEFENWRQEKEKSNEMTVELLSEWIKNKVIPAFTVVSVTYCKKVPGFSTFDTCDQVKIIKFGQSPSRMLAAVLHWFEPATKNFKHFLSWRDHVPGMNDRFKQSLIKFALKMQELHLDPIEAALLNSLIIVSTDYADLSNTKVIETLRCQIISTFRAYTTAKYGMPNDRLEKLFQNIPELRKLGLLHNEMTNTKTMMAEEFGDRLLMLLNL